MTRSALTLSFSTHDQVENDVKDMIYQLRESPTLSFPTPDQVEGDIKDTVYQTSGISSILSFPMYRESPFFKDGIPNQVGNDSFVIFIVILTHIIRY